jgi:hypothetical protein
MVSQEPSSRESARILEKWWVVASGVVIYVILAAGLFWPSLPWSQTTLPSGVYGRGFGDPAQMTWFLEWFSYALRHGIDIFHTNFLDYPSGVDLANGTSVPLLGLIATPVTLTLGPVAAFNLLFRLAFASSATSMFLVLRNWSRTPFAFIGGLLYGFGPYMISQGQNHLNLIFVPLPPIIVWCLYELLFVQRRRPGRMGLLLGALCGAQALINAETLAFTGVVTFFGLIALAIIDRRCLRARFEFLVRAFLPAVVVFLVLAGYLLWSMFFAAGHLVGPVYPTHALQGFRADLLEPIVPSDLQFISPLSLAVLAYHFTDGNFTETASYLSLPFVLLFAYFAVRWRRDRLVLSASLLALLAFVLSLGNRLDVKGMATSIPLPEAIFAHLPLLDSTVPARYAFLVALFGVITVTIGADRFVAGLKRREHPSSGARLIDLGVVAAMLSALILMFPLVPEPTQGEPWAPDTVSTLNAIPSGTATLTYPFTMEPWTEAMSWQALDGMHFRLIGGYVTEQESPNYGESFPSLIAPKVVEETLIRDQFGANKISGEQTIFPAPDAKANLQRAFCTFLRRHDVGAVVFWKGRLYRGVDPSAAHRLFSDALGAPGVTNANRTLLIWLAPARHCTS